MERSNQYLNQLKYFRITASPDINIDKADIFYRKKYNIIINYLKMILTGLEDSVSIDYIKYIKPKGCLLVNINPGSDIDFYLKQISKNYQLSLIELNYNEIIKNPKRFIDDFPNVIEEFIRNEYTKDKKKDTTPKSSIENDNIAVLKDNYKIFIINENDFPPNFINDKYMLSRFINYFKNSDFFLKYETILIWVNNFFQEVVENQNKIYKIFDLLIKIPILDKIERKELLKSFSESNPKIVFDINTLVEKTQDWEVDDLYQLLKVAIFKHFLNSELNDSSNEITEILVDLIEEGEFLPSFVITNQLNNRKYTTVNLSQDFSDSVISQKKISIKNQEKITNEYINHFQNETISEFMLEQLYEDAASKNYNELIIIIDKLSKKEILEDNDRKLLGKFPFLLNENPKMAQIRLEKAKKRIDQIRKVFGNE
jgi:hypothetical protein